MSLNKSRAEEGPVIGTKMFTSFKVYLMQRNWTLYILIHHIRDDSYQAEYENVLRNLGMGTKYTIN